MHLVALVLAPFAFTMSGFAFAGLLEPMAAALGVPVAVAGTLQSAFALACAVAGPVLARATARAPRKTLLLGTLATLAALNLASSVAPDFETLFVLRLLAGGLGALSVPLAMAIAAALAAPERRPGAIATVYSGIALAMMLGVPLGSVAGEAAGWPACFALAAAVCVLGLALTAGLVPSVAVPPPALAAPARLDGGVIACLGVTFLAFAAMFALVGFIGPAITATTGLGARAIPPFQMLSGVGCLLGLVLGARMARRASRSRARGQPTGGIGLALLFAGMGLSLIVLLHPLATGGGGVLGVGAMLLSVIIGPVALFATAPIVQTRLAETAGASATFAFALNGSMVYLGQGAGVGLGAAAIGSAGLAGAPAAGAVLAVLGAALALTAARAPVVAATR